jgi:adenine-specific DNA-methyltransferase
MARGKNSGNGHSKKRPTVRYEHTDKKRINNPPVGLVTLETDPPLPTHKVYDYIEPVPSVKPGKDLDYDPHLDPQLVRAGEKDHASFDVPTISLHVHETIDPRTIIEAVRKRNGNGLPTQPSLFERPEEKMPLRDAVEFYRHAHGWSNRPIAGDSLLVMNSLLEKEGMAGQVQMVYIDPPYGIKYGSNFQPFVNKRDVKDGKDEDLTQEPEMIQAFRDTSELGIHSYLTYLRGRLLLARELLHETGSCFVQISDQNLHLVRSAMDDVFRAENFGALICFRKTGGLGSAGLKGVDDFILWYARENGKCKYRQLYVDKAATAVSAAFQPVSKLRDLASSGRAPDLKIPEHATEYITVSLTSSGATPSCIYPYEFQGKTYNPVKGGSWKPNRDGMEALRRAGRLIATGDTLRWVYYREDFSVSKLTSRWDDTGGAADKVCVVQTSSKVIERVGPNGPKIEAGAVEELAVKC